MADPSLFRWERISKPRVYSRSQKVTTGDEIQDWIRTVEEASSRAAAATFGTQYTRPKSEQVISRPAVDIQLHNAAFSEAQELLKQWASEKLNFGDEFLDENGLENVEIQPLRTPSEIKQEWDCLTDQNESSSRAMANFNRDPYQLLHTDEDVVVGSIMQSLLQKNVLKEEFMLDLGSDLSKKQPPDPRTKMNIRHQQVKQNRDQRLKEKQLRLQEQQAKKNVEHHARHLLSKEEKAKELKLHQEEMAIQKEMNRIRKQLEDEKLSKANENMRKKQDSEQLESALKMERTRLEAEMETTMLQQQQTGERQKKMLERMVTVQRRQLIETLKLKRQCFTAWYNMIIMRRLQLSKAKAVGDWKTLFRVFSAWRSSYFNNKAEKEANQHESVIKQMHRKELYASQHYRLRLLYKTLITWRAFVICEQRERDLENARLGTRNKMAAFIEAAASGKLWNDGQVMKRVDSARPGSVSSADSRGPDTKLVSLQTEASQLTTRQQVRPGKVLLSEGNRTNRGGHNQMHQVTSVTTLSVQNGTRVAQVVPMQEPSNHNYVVPINSFQHRHDAQQRILEQQQQQLREQRHIIEEMQALQRQQMLQQQLGATSQRPSSGQLPGTKQKTFEPTHLHKHLVNLQNDLMENVDRQSQQQPISSSRTDSSHSAITKQDSRHVKFVDAMEKRAAERERLRKEREERKQKMEEDKLMQLQQAENERKEKEEEEKREKLRRIKERKELERKREVEKQAEEEKAKGLLLKAEQHHKKAVIKFWGWRPWCKLVEHVKAQERRASDFYCRILLKHVLLSWRKNLQQEQAAKEKAANDLRTRLLTRRCLASWKKCKQISEIDERKATRFHERHLKRRLFGAWADFTEAQQLSAEENDKLCQRHNIIRMQKQCFHAWRRYPAAVREAQKLKKRLQEMRKTVASLLPDYSGANCIINDSGDESV